jgi:hypothetical protein
MSVQPRITQAMPPIARALASHQVGAGDADGATASGTLTGSPAKEPRPEGGSRGATLALPTFTPFARVDDHANIFSNIEVADYRPPAVI